MSTRENPPSPKPSGRWPEGLMAFEQRLGQLLPLSPNAISSLKLFVIAPLFLLALLAPPLPWARLLPIPLLLLFGLLDYLDGLIARQQDRETPFGRIYDRLTDYPILLALVWLSVGVLPAGLLSLKVGLDVILLALFALGRGPTENRLRTAINFLTLLMLLLLVLDVNSRFITGGGARVLLILNVFVTAFVILRNLGVLQKRFIADALSAGNLLCGFGSMAMAWQGRLDLSLVFLMLGAAFDGLDGAAARRYGSTRWGVFSDDIADGVNYGIAPGVAILLHFRTPAGIDMEGLVIGLAFIVFTISRLVFFYPEQEVRRSRVFPRRAQHGRRNRGVVIGVSVPSPTGPARFHGRYCLCADGDLRQPLSPPRPADGRPPSGAGVHGARWPVVVPARYLRRAAPGHRHDSGRGAGLRLPAHGVQFPGGLACASLVL